MRIDVRNGTEIWQPTYRGKLVGRTDLSILDQYNGEVRGFCNYYAIANNRSKLHKFRYIMEYSFYKTLACKYRTTKGKIIAQYRIVKDIGVKFQDKHGNERIRLLWKDSLARDPYPLGKEADIIHLYYEALKDNIAAHEKEQVNPAKQRKPKYTGQYTKKAVHRRRKENNRHA